MILVDYLDIYSSKMELKNLIKKYIEREWRNTTNYISHNILEELHFIKSHVAICNGVPFYLQRFDNEDGSYCYKKLNRTENDVNFEIIPHIVKNNSDWIETETWSAKILENINEPNNNKYTKQEEYYEKAYDSSAENEDRIA